ncbi:MAG: NAD(P)H-hydrate epimerase [Candidatus Magasanikbacteria bacterium CG10_big_fil_rev_8_21_14_0_10_47_10]|uniref:NAD(P)H-hydrate epimerase n=1 Tax=Candidatus Magasanikbacteria bacterium CG10_big_fil_rev_8_21_14_0_10_47_10 TaxID=1974652 RepID=A0A2H0TRM5_9BACT|nr:MAG: NAD(P)H-hydrate epimerase [Candidatus Magasanikbacteria bacterium CG10_big_fil_rev_8_21_14_0_10_47_10]
MYYATAKEMERLDNLAVQNGLEIRQMMELAGWHMFSLLAGLKISTRAKIVIVVGKGNKGGDGLSAARHLVNNGWDVSALLLSREISPDAEHHLQMITMMKVPIMLYSKNKEKACRLIGISDILIDALIGYHLDGTPRGVFKEVIKLINATGKKIIAYDLPSGIDATSGECRSLCVQAYATLSLALPKRAFRIKKSRAACGRIFIADIGIPEFLYDEISSGSRPVFEHSGLTKEFKN